MKLKICSLVVVLLYNHCLLHQLAASATLNKNDPEENVQNVESAQSEIIDDKLQLAELGEDCLHTIFGYMDLVGLLNMTKTMPQFDHITIPIFRQKYSHYKFRIMKDDDQKPGGEFDYEIPYGYPTEFRFYRLELLQELLQYFGNDMNRITIENKMDNNLTMANRLVNEYCSESVKELDLQYISPNGLLQYSKPFNAVKKLICTIGIELDGNFTLNQLFPSLQQLEISLTNDVNFNSVDCSFPHLRRLELKVLSRNDERQHQFEGLIRKNPQIQSIYLEAHHFDLLRTVSEVMPNVVNLEVDNLKTRDNNTIRFGNVDNFALRSVEFDDLEKLSFSHLNSFEMIYLDKNEQLSGFLKRHQHLNRLRINDFMFGPVVLDELTADLPNLVEIIVEDREVSIDSIIRFVNNHRKLMKFQIRREIGDDRELVEFFENDWHIQRSSYYTKYEEFIFERARNLHL